MTINQAELKKAMRDRRFWTESDWLAHYARRTRHPANQAKSPCRQPFDDNLRPASRLLQHEQDQKTARACLDNHATETEFCKRVLNEMVRE